jgi:hypothetical protein
MNETSDPARGLVAELRLENNTCSCYKDHNKKSTRNITCDGDGGDAIQSLLCSEMIRENQKKSSEKLITQKTKTRHYQRKAKYGSL